MKKNIFYLAICLVLATTSCKKSDFADAYPNPATANVTTVEKQFAGFMASDIDYTMYKYNNYFIVLQNTVLHYAQLVGWANSAGQYIPGAAAITTRWNNFYNFLAQYKEFLNVYNNASAQDQADKKIYKMLATIFFYDQTQKQVDLHGDLPWSAAGLLSTNGGNYSASYAKYDAASAIYTQMLDNLKTMADDLNAISVPSAVSSVLSTQDFINHGNVTLWKKYCNSLRLRLLMRVSGATAFQSRASSEIAAILANPTAYPLILTNADNNLITVSNSTNDPGINNGTSTGDNASFYQGLIGWGYNDQANKPMMDFMNANNDPRLRVVFEPGAKANGVYTGLDLALGSSTQTTLQAGGTIARYNRSTLSQNVYLPGVLITAAEVNFLLSEYYMNAGNLTSARTAYETGINASVDYYYYVRTLSTSTVSGAVTPATAAEKTAYLASTGVNWTNATTNAARMNLIATQKWINYGVLEPLEAWAEYRRTKLPVMNFVTDNSTTVLQLPPNRLVYPTDESTYNTTNYSAVKANDTHTAKLFWDVK